MAAKTVYTEEIDDLELAAAELHAKLKDFHIMKNTLGIVFCDVETDEIALVEELHKYYDFPIIGATTVAMITTEHGYKDTGISLMVLTCDYGEFCADMTEELTAENAQEEITKTYNKIKASMNTPEKLALVYAPQMTYLTGDSIVNYLTAINPDVHLFGGIASDSFDLTSNRIFYNDISSRSRIIIVLIGGNIHPVFQQQYSIIDDKGIMSEVTKSEENVVYEVTGGKLLDVLNLKGMGIAKADAYIEFVGSVFEANIKVDNGEYISVMRDLRSVNVEDGSAVFLGNVPVGSKMRLCMLNKENITNSVKGAFKDVIAQIKDHPDYKYTTFLCTSCAGRFLNLATEPDAEGKACQELLPEGMTICAMYSYGEICPTYTPTGQCYNVFHNKTFTLVAF